jgi:hypothetical protein
MAVAARGPSRRTIFTVSSIMLMWNLVNFGFSWQLLRFLGLSIVIPRSPPQRGATTTGRAAAAARCRASLWCLVQPLGPHGPAAQPASGCAGPSLTCTLCESARNGLWRPQVAARRSNNAPRPIRAAPTIGAPLGACGWVTYAVTPPPRGI